MSIPHDSLPLKAFWHRTRQCVVPLTSREWEERASVSVASRSRLVRAGQVRKSVSGGTQGSVTIYTLTQTGRDALAELIGEGAV